MTVSKTYRFHEVFEEEIRAINKRRGTFGRAEAALEVEPDTDSGPPTEPASEAGSPHGASGSESEAAGPKSVDPDRECIKRPTKDSNLVGLALSGRGIRSASFCLGAMQALDNAQGLNDLSYA